MTLPIQPDYPLLRVVWTDSAATADWMEPDAVEKALRCTPIITIGWRVLDAEDRIVMASSHNDDWSLVGEIIAIPRVAILSSEPLL